MNSMEKKINDMLGDLVTIETALVTHETMKSALELFPVELQEHIVTMLIHAYCLGMSKTITAIKEVRTVIH